MFEKSGLVLWIVANLRTQISENTQVHDWRLKIEVQSIFNVIQNENNSNQLTNNIIIQQMIKDYYIFSLFFCISHQWFEGCVYISIITTIDVSVFTLTYNKCRSLELLASNQIKKDLKLYFEVFVRMNEWSISLSLQVKTCMNHSWNYYTCIEYFSEIVFWYIELLENGSFYEKNSIIQNGCSFINLYLICWALWISGIFMI